MDKITETIKFHKIRFNLFLNAVWLVSCVSPDKANQMIEWVSDNVEKFYKVKMYKGR